VDKGDRFFSELARLPGIMWRQVKQPWFLAGVILLLIVESGWGLAR
jgi:hypothetical protein